LTGAALAFVFGLPVLGLILGGMVVIGATILTTTLWCLGSWIYRMILGVLLRDRSTTELRMTVDLGHALSDTGTSPRAAGGHVREDTPTATR
jgi:hypothetical protein